MMRFEVTAEFKAGGQKLPDGHAGRATVCGAGRVNGVPGLSKMIMLGTLSSVMQIEGRDTVTDSQIDPCVPLIYCTL